MAPFHNCSNDSIACHSMGSVAHWHSMEYRSSRPCRQRSTVNSLRDPSTRIGAIDGRSCRSGGARPSMAFSPGRNGTLSYLTMRVAIGRQAGFSSCWCRVEASVAEESLPILDTSIPSCSLLMGSSPCHGETGKGADAFLFPRSPGCL
jgi:hypothetical protein